MTIKGQMLKTFEEKHVGAAPAENSVIKTQLEMIKALNHYNYFYTRADATSVLTKYFRKYDRSVLETRDIEKAPTTLAWLIMMRARNVQLPNGSLQKIKQMIDAIPLKKVEDEVKVLPLRKADNKTILSNIIAKLEEMIDNAFDGKYETPRIMLSAYKLDKGMLKVIRLKYASILAEMKSKDEQVLEAYAYLSKEKRKAVMNFLNDLIAFTWGEKFEKPKKAIRKTKANPFAIDGSKFVLLYNPANQFAVIFQSDEGIEMDGTWMKNVGETKFTKITDTEAFLAASKKGGYTESLDAMTKFGSGLVENKSTRIAKAHTILRK